MAISYSMDVFLQMKKEISVAWRLVLKNILAKKGVTYKNIWFDSKSKAGEFTSGLYSYPTTYVVDKNGNIVGEPIVGAITSEKQSEKLQKLIDQAIANSKNWCVPVTTKYQ